MSIKEGGPDTAQPADETSNMSAEQSASTAVDETADEPPDETIDVLRDEETDTPDPAQVDPEMSAHEQKPLADEEINTPPPIPPPVDVHDLDWDRIGTTLEPQALRARMSETVERLEALLDSGIGARMLFDDCREDASDRALNIDQISDEPLWFIGDIHGDLLALESALTLIDREAGLEGVEHPRIVFLGDLFDDGGYGLETLLRFFELVLARHESICFIAGNH
ncbi:MAG: metallophosphoesterase, partial [Gemmatimonadaceae bacterium]